MKIKITGKDRGELLSISTDLQFLPVLTCNQESLGERDLLEAYIEGRAGIRELVTNPPQLRAVLQKENINLSFFSATYDFLKTYNMELVSSLFASTSLISLNLFGTQLGELGSRELANVLKATNSLAYLKVSYNDMGYHGQLELSEGLTENKSLTALDLSNDSNVDDLSYFFDVCLPDINAAEKLVNNYPQGPQEYLNIDLLLGYMDLARHYCSQPLKLFQAIGHHPAIRYFSFGVICDRDLVEFLHNKMLEVKGLVLQTKFNLDDFDRFIQPSSVEIFKNHIEQVNKLMIINFMATMQEVAGYMGEERSIKFSPKMIAQCIKFTNLLAGASEKTIDLPVEIREFIGDNYLLFLLAVLRKDAGNSLLEKLPLDTYKNISSYLFNLDLGKWAKAEAIDYSIQEEDEMSIVGAIAESNIEDII